LQSWGFEVIATEDPQFLKTVKEHNRPIAQEFITIPGVTRHSFPELAASYEGKGVWEVDIPAGVQRWHGTKSGKWLAATLRKLGIKPKKVMKIARSLSEKGCVPYYH